MEFRRTSMITVLCGGGLFFVLLYMLLARSQLRITDVTVVPEQMIHAVSELSFPKNAPKTLKELESAYKTKKECGIVWLYHIGKTGGSTIRDAMNVAAESCSDNEMNCKEFKMFTRDNSDAEYLAQMENLMDVSTNISERTQFFVWQHHRSFGFGSRVHRHWVEMIRRNAHDSGCGFLLMTSVREPYSAMLSLVNYNEIIQSERVSYIDVSGNFQIKYLLDNIWGEKTPYEVTERELNEAKFVITNHFDMVGSTDCMGTFLEKVRTITGWNVNVTHWKNSHSKKVTTDEEAEHIRKATAMDRKFYDWALDYFGIHC